MELAIESRPKAKRSNKPLTVQAAVIAQTMNGVSKSQIASDLGISRNTVYSVLAANEIEQLVSEGRSRAVTMIPRSLDVIDTRLSKGSETAALAILRGTNVLQSQAQQVTTNNSFAINLLQLKQAREQTVQNGLPAQLEASTAIIQPEATPKRKPGRPKKATTNSVPDPAKP